MMELLLILILLTDVALCSTGRLRVLVRTAAWQGFFLGLLALCKGFTFHAATLAAATIAVKAVIFPYILNRAIRKSGTLTEPLPYVSYNLSIVLCALMLGLCVLAADRLPSGQWRMAASIGFFTMFTGFFLIITRRTAFSQVIGYLALEGGIYAFGLSLWQEMQVEVEMGLLLDVFAAIFIMGIVIYRISSEFEHADTARLDFLNDSEEYD
ncbi:MAG: hydrogenase [Elusimicrobia bacterium]|nr:hydrogenase [Elusimicrobiota bacterium]